MRKLKGIPFYEESEIVNRIQMIRGQKVMIDRDLAELYGVSTSRLNEAVKRNKNRFPKDFMFQLTSKEIEILISQIAISRWGGSRKLPYVFTEQGVAMLSSVLKSERAVQVNIQIIRVYIRMKQVLIDNHELWHKIEEIEHSLLKKNEEVKAIFDILKKIFVQESKPRRRIGFKIPKRN